MNTYEIANKSAPRGEEPWEGRPHSTIQDWIAAGARYGELELRPFIQLLDDDDMQHAHDSGLCGLCNDTISVADREQWMVIEMAHYDVKWDPTIRL